MSEPTVRAFFAAMQAGPDGAAALFALFDDDAVYIEPFSGSPQTHEGLPAIRAAFQTGWSTPLPDVRITVDRVDVQGSQVEARWTCHSPGLPGGAASGRNAFTVEGGRIRRLETSFG